MVLMLVLALEGEIVCCGIGGGGCCFSAGLNVGSGALGGSVAGGEVGLVGGGGGLIPTQSCRSRGSSALGVFGTILK